MNNGLWFVTMSVMVFVCAGSVPVHAASIKTPPPYDWEIDYHQEDSSDPDYCPSLRVQWHVAAFHDDDNVPSTEPDGYLQAYDNTGFPAPNVDGNDVYIREAEKNNANDDRIELRASRCRTGTYLGQFDTIGHEIFHGIQYAYTDGLNDKTMALGDYVVEGHAKTMEGKMFIDFEDIDGVVKPILTAPGLATNANGREYLEDLTRVRLWSEDYETALWWLYLSKEYGQDQSAPGYGLDFMRRFWEKAQALEDENSGTHVLRKTLNDLGESASLKEIFRRFSVANAARKFAFAGSAVPSHSQNRYPQEFDNGVDLFGTVSLSKAFQLAEANGFGSSSVSDYASRYYLAELKNVDITCQTGVVGFLGEADSKSLASFNVFFVDDQNTIRYMASSGDKGQLGDRFAATIATDRPGGVSQVWAVVNGLESSRPPENGGEIAYYNYTFACGPASVDITSPDLVEHPQFPLYAGLPDEPERVMLRVRVNGPPALSETSVLGLSKDEFTVYIGDEADPKIPANIAEVIAAHPVQGEYVLVVQPPAKPGDPRGSVYDLVVKLGTQNQTFGVVFDTEASSVVYDVQAVDMQLVIDQSGSMEDFGKIEAAKSAAKAFVDWAQSDDQLGVTEFAADANLILPLDVMSSEAVRAVYKALIETIDVGGSTSMGDGLAIARDDLISNGRPSLAEPIQAEHWIVLLSDGFENQPEWVDDVMPSVSSNRIRVHTIALGSETDQHLLQWIADQPSDSELKGRFEYVPDPDEPPATQGLPAATAASSDLALNLADVYRTMFEQAHRYERLLERRGSGNFSEQLNLEENNITDAVLSVVWQNASAPMTLTLTDPLGNPVTTATPGARVVSDAGHAVVQLDDLSPGVWVINVAGDGDYHLVLSGKVREGVNLDLLFGQFHQDGAALSLKGLYLPGLPMPIIAMMTDSTGPIVGASVHAEILNPDGSTAILELFDDGAHYDSVANDGVYANHYQLTHTASTGGFQQDPPAGNVGPGSYKVTVNATGENNQNEAFERITKASFQLFDHPELFADREPDTLIDRWENRFDCVDSLVMDQNEDPDEDNLTNREEMFNGTHPCNPDTDFGGERDGSEVAGGRNPLVAGDDLIAPIDELEIITHLKHTRQPEDGWLIAGGLVLRIGMHPSFTKFDIYRRKQGGSFVLIDTIDAPASKGIYRDLGLEDGVTYEYYVVPFGENGVPGTASFMVSGTARGDPFPPDGTLLIDQGLSVVTDNNHELALTYSVDTVEMRIAQDSTFDGIPWMPASPAATFSTAGNGFKLIHAQFRDADGNESLPVSESVTVNSGLQSGNIGGTITLEPVNPYGGLAGVLAVAGPHSTLSNSAGQFLLSDLALGAYPVNYSRFGYQTDQGGVVNLTSPGVTAFGLITMYALDTDNDGVWDLDEHGAGTDYENADSDGDGVQDGTELGLTEGVPDPDGNGPLLGTDAGFFIADTDPTTTTDPNNADSDGDGASDGEEDLNGNGKVDPGETDPQDPNSYPVTEQVPALPPWAVIMMVLLLLGVMWPAASQHGVGGFGRKR